MRDLLYTTHIPVHLVDRGTGTPMKTWSRVRPFCQSFSWGPPFEVLRFEEVRFGLKTEDRFVSEQYFESCVMDHVVGSGLGCVCNMKVCALGSDLMW
jgi:hypothetical protein